MQRILLRVAIIVVLLISAGAFFYTLFLSPNSANHDAIMTLRYAYTPLLQRLHLPESVIRVARRDTADPDFYWYALRGQVEQVDPDHLVIRGNDGQLYRFNMYWRLPDAHTVQHIGLDGNNLREDQNEWLWFTFTLDPPLIDPNEYTVVWRDKRPLTDILTAYRNAPEQPLNTIERFVRYLIRYDQSS